MRPKKITRMTFITSILLSLPCSGVYVLASGFVSPFKNSYSINSYQNPAELIPYGNYQILLSVEPSRFGIKELNSAEARFGKKLFDKYCYGIGIEGIYSDKFYKLELKSSLSYKFDDDFSLGLGVSYNSIGFKDYSKSYKISPYVGVVFNFSKDLKTAFYLNNVSRSYYKNYPDVIEQTAAFGLAYKYSDKFSADIISAIHINNGVGSGINLNYIFMKELKLFLSYYTNPQSINLGISFSAGDNFIVNLQGGFDNSLGTSKILQCEFVQ